MLRNEFNGGLARYTAKVVISEYWVVFFSNKICTFCAFYRPRANFFCSEWRNSRLWRDSRVILCNQKSVFTQFPTTWLLQHRLERGWWKAKHHSPAPFAAYCCKTWRIFFLQETASFEWLFKQKELNFFALENVSLNWRKLLCGFPQSHDLK